MVKMAYCLFGHNDDDAPGCTKSTTTNEKNTKWSNSTHLTLEFCAAIQCEDKDLFFCSQLDCRTTTNKFNDELNKQFCVKVLHKYSYQYKD